ncbi:MAG: hypothetical protein ACR2OO_00870 [Thermomicrobiales bacterium]
MRAGHEEDAAAAVRSSLRSIDTPRRPWRDEFPAAYERAQRRQRLARAETQKEASIRAERTRVRLDRLSDEQRAKALRFMEPIREERKREREAVRERCENRREFPARRLAFDGPLRECWREGFTVEGFPSDPHVLFRLMVTRLPGGTRGLFSGGNKEQLSSQDSKLLALDDLYVEWSKTMRGVFRKDVDRVFPSIPALKADILACGAPLPNLIVGVIDDEGQVHRPHLYYLLADAVCCTGKGRAGPKALFDAVSRGLTKLLLPIGADPGGDSNASRGKNPLSPGWDRVVCVEVPYQLTAEGPRSYPDLPTLRPYADFSVTREELRRRAAERIGTEVLLRDGQTVPSNAHFELLRRYAWAIVGPYLGDGEAGMDRFATAVEAYAKEIAARCDVSDEEKGIERRAEYVWSWVWDHARSRRGASRPNRGCLQEATRGKSRAQAQAIGGRYSAFHKKGGKQETFEKLLDAVYGLRAEGGAQAKEMPTNAVLAHAAGVAIRTVQRHRDALAEALRGDDRRSYDKKGISPHPGAPTRSAGAPPSSTAHASLPGCATPTAPTTSPESGEGRETPAERYVRIRPTLDDQTPHDPRLIFRSPGRIVWPDPTKPFSRPSVGLEPWFKSRKEAALEEAILDILYGNKPAPEPVPQVPEPQPGHLVLSFSEWIEALRKQEGAVPKASPAQQTALDNPH